MNSQPIDPIHVPDAGNEIHSLHQILSIKDQKARDKNRRRPPKDKPETSADPVEADEAALPEQPDAPRRGSIDYYG